MARPRDAASVIVLRDGAAGLEVFCVVRSARSGFLGGALVFPGGKLDADDAAASWADLTSPPHERAERLAGPEAPALALAVAACRETLEEGGILPVLGSLDAAQIEAIRAEHDPRGSGEAGGVSAAAGANACGRLGRVLARMGMRLALGRLVPWGRWVTPAAESRRYDARFFLLDLPQGQEGRHDRHETTMSLWARPADVLGRFVRGELFLAPPTTRSLELLAQVGTVRAAIELAAAQSLDPVCPRFVPGDGATPPFLALPGDPAHEVAARRVAGPTRFVLRDARFVSEDPPECGAAPGPEPEGARDSEERRGGDSA